MSKRKPFYSQERESWAIPLTRGVIALVDTDMAPILAQHNWCASRVHNAWYAVRGCGPHGSRGRILLMHREIMSPPDDMSVDHREHREFAEKVVDNRRANLRVCTHRQNHMNQRPRSGGTSRYKGVCWNRARDKWMARIQINGKSKFLGNFSDELAAATAYDAAAVEHFGDFALLNEAA